METVFEYEIDAHAIKWSKQPHLLLSLQFILSVIHVGEGSDEAMAFPVDDAL